ncbi:MAG TPA: glycosyltransferase family 4 protein [Burkholderiales bacterium]|nr:glycosyltransferase family 4 protein [Burkholderiales bacterium]
METRLAMLGAAPETRGSIASVVETYRALGLFSRWPIEYIVTHTDGTPLERLGAWRRAARLLAAELAQHRRLAVHLHTTPQRLALDSVFFGAALLARAPVLVHLHGGGFGGLYERAGTPGRTLIPMLLERAAAVGVNSEALRTWVSKLTRNANVVHLPDPVAIPEARQAAPVPGLVVFLGRLEARQGIFDLLEALGTLRKHVPELRLVCAGEGDRDAVTRHAERLGLASAVKFTGWVGPSGKRALLESAAAFALPSYDEGIPVSLLEAMAAGVPSVASRVDGVTEVVVDGVSGLLVPPGDRATLARALKEILLDVERAARLGGAARESVRRRFGAERTIAPLEDIYRRMGLSDYAFEVKKAA